MYRGIVTAICFIASTQAAGQQGADAGAWRVERDRATVAASGISIPARAGGLSLVKTAEASQAGSAVDNIAQYESADAAVAATVYIFYASYADTALSTWATDRAIRQRYGADVTLVSDTVSAAGGTAHAATRRIYDKAVRGGGPLVTAAGFVRVGSWLVGLRVTGPADRRAETETAIDALLSGLRFDGKNQPMRAEQAEAGAPCPAGAEKPAKYLKGKNAGGMAFFAALSGGSIVSDNDEAGAPKNGATVPVDLPPAFPANGAAAWCVRGTIVAGAERYDVLQPASAIDGKILLVPIDDAGGIFAIEPTILLDGFVVKRYGIASVEVLGSFKSMPSIDQIGAIITGRDSQGATIRSSTSFTPDGNSAIRINPDMLK